MYLFLNLAQPSARTRWVFGDIFSSPFFFSLLPLGTFLTRWSLMWTLTMKNVMEMPVSYHERSLAYASTKDMLDVCLPKVDKNNVADWFESCDDKKMEDVCVFAKRGWLIKDASSSESVADVNLLKQIFGKLEGGEEARKECLNEQEEN